MSYSKKELDKAVNDLLKLADSGTKELEFNIEGKKYILNLQEYAKLVRFNRELGINRNEKE